MEEDTHAGFAYSSEKEHFTNCDFCKRQCTLDDYENHLKPKTDIHNFSRLINNRKFCDICKDDINNSSWNKHVKNLKNIAGSAERKCSYSVI